MRVPRRGASVDSVLLNLQARAQDFVRVGGDAGDHLGGRRAKEDGGRGDIGVVLRACEESGVSTCSQKNETGDEGGEKTHDSTP